MNRADFLQASVLAPLLLADRAAAAAPVHGEFADFCELFYRQKRVRQAFEKYVVEDYIQHSPGMSQGRAAAIATLEPMFARENFRPTPIRVLQDRDLVAVILDVRTGDATRAIVIDIFRQQHGKLVEHWDVKLALDPAQQTSYFNGMQGAG
jgi:predicted SnoaL-like aldol condensation-catalyzing enzyme